jgi:hypothetical protein
MTVIKNLFEEADRESLLEKATDTKNRFNRHMILSKTEEYKKKMQAVMKFLIFAVCIGIS